MTGVKVPSLIEILAEIPDKRHKNGKRHPLVGMLARLLWESQGGIVINTALYHTPTART